MFNSAVV